VLVWFIPERARTESPTESIWRSLLPSAGLPPVTRAVFLALLPSMAATWALGGLYLSLGSSILRTVLGVQSHFVVGIVLGVFFAAGAAGPLVTAPLAPRPREWFGYATLILGLIVTVAAMVVGALPLYVVGSLAAGVGFGATFRFVISALGEVAPADQRGQVFATMYIVSYLAFSLPGLAAGLAVGRFGLEPTAVTYGGSDVALVAAAMLAAVVQARRRAGVDEPWPACPALSGAR